MTTYRPQFVHPPAPPGFEDEQFHYVFDGTSCPLLAAAKVIPAGGFANDIVLLMQADAEFICRALYLRSPTGGATNLYFQLKTPRGDYMQSVPVPASLYAFSNAGGAGGLIAGHNRTPLEAEIVAPAGSNWTLYLYNPTSGNVAPPMVTLFGVKRRKCTSVRGRAA